MDIEHEPEATETGKSPAAWPTSGDLRVENLSARYSQVCLFAKFTIKTFSISTLLRQAQKFFTIFPSTSSLDNALELVRLVSTVHE